MFQTHKPNVYLPLIIFAWGTTAFALIIFLSMPSATSERMISVENEHVPVQAGETRPRRHPQVGSGELNAQYTEGVTTLYDAFVSSTKQFGKAEFMGVRNFVNGVAQGFEFETYEQAAARVRNLAAGLATLGLGEKANIGLYSINRPEWILGEQACFANNFVTVPLYDTLGDEAVEYICEQTGMEVIIIDVKKIHMILELKGKIPKLKKLLVMDEVVPGNLKKEAAEKGLELLIMAEFEKKGVANKDFVPIVPVPEDLCTICYTSGTTGRPKGAMISHASLIAAISSALFLVGQNKVLVNPKPVYQLETLGEVYLSFLPLAHIFERVVFSVLMILGTKVGFYQGDVTKLLSDIEELKPTFFVSVPRLFNRVHDKIMAGVDAKGGMAKWLFNHALAVKLANLRRHGSHTHWLWDRIVFEGIKAKLGGRVKVMLTGAAPLSPQILDFLRVVFCCEVFEGYGMTESCAVTAVTHKDDLIQSQVGGPVPGVEIKLVDIPEMGYTSKDKPCPRGEIWIRGPTIFTGYYQNKEQTDETMTDGWLNTGDVGMFDEVGRLFIIDRKKALFKLAQGEYISPEKIEAQLARSPLIAQAYVEGNSLKSYIVAVVILDEETLLPWAKNKGIEGDFAKVCQNPRTKDAVMKEIVLMGNTGSKDLRGFEIPKAVHLDTELFTPENGLVTPTFKLKRAQAKAKYGAIVQDLYASVKE